VGGERARSERSRGKKMNHRSRLGVISESTKSQEKDKNGFFPLKKKVGAFWDEGIKRVSEGATMWCKSGVL